MGLITARHDPEEMKREALDMANTEQEEMREDCPSFCPMCNSGNCKGNRPDDNEATYQWNCFKCGNQWGQ